MAASFYFYDLETSGFNPRTARIMQFAGQRTDMELNPVGEPHDFYIKLSDELVPDPDAIMITGITPQQTNSDGLTEVNFLKLFHEEIAVPGTIFAGFNSVRFDDEFMRYLHYRNFYDAYEWQWQDMRSRWDLLDVIRMTRALRPEGIVWPVDAKGNPTNRLELLAAANNIDHRKAHTALSDVNATIALARLVRDKQPKLFNFLLNLRDKKKVEEFIQGEPAFLYSSGKYSSEIEKTAVVTVLANHPKRQGVLVYDLRCDPSEFANMSAAELADAWKWKKDARTTRLPVKTLQFNRCPAVAPLSVLNKAAQQRLKLNVDTINKHLAQLRILKDWNKRIVEALQLIDQQRQASFLAGDRMVDEQLSDGFFDQPDKDRMAGVRQARPAELAAYEAQFSDQRLRALLPLYKARNFPKHLTDEERAAWEKYRTERLLGGQDKSQLAGYFKRLGELGQRTDLTQDQQYLLEELQLYGQSIMPVVD